MLIWCSALCNRCVDSLLTWPSWVWQCGFWASGPLALLVMGVVFIRKLVSEGELEYKKAPKIDFGQLKKELGAEPSIPLKCSMAYTAWREFRFPGAGLS